MNLAPFAAGIAAGAALVFCGISSSALAHDVLESSTPASDEVVTSALHTVSLSFSDTLLVLNGEVGGFAIRVQDVAGGYYQSGCLTLAENTASTEVALGEAGSYQVTWQVVASDGHPTSGTYSFTWQPPVGYSPAPAFAQVPDCGASWAGSAPSALQSSSAAPTENASITPQSLTNTATASSTADPTDGSEVPGAFAILLGLGGTALLAVIIALVLKRNR